MSTEHRGTELREIDFPPKDEALRADVRLLGDLVGEMLREQGGERLFGQVEAARQAAIRRREHTPEDGASPEGELEATLSGLDAAEAAEIVRAFSAYFQVVNLAERTHRVRRGREYMRDPARPQEGSLAEAVRRLLELGIAPERLPALFDEVRLEPVFTAHPTESTRRTILDKQERIAAELIARIDPTRTPHEERVSLAIIRQNITASWQTDEHPAQRPTVADERDRVLYYVSRVLYRVLPSLHEHVAEALEAAGASMDAASQSPPVLLRPGSWVGGDMDGNPNVDASTIRQTLRRHREVALSAYDREIGTLARQLTQSATRVRWSEALTERSEAYGQWFPEVARDLPARRADMGYRIFLDLVRARLAATREETEHGYPGPEGLQDDLELLARSLEENRGHHAGLFGVGRLLHRVRAFGFHLASLDLRQDARELREVLGELLGDPSWPERPAAERAERLRGLLAGPDADLPRSDLPDERVRATLEVFESVAEGQRHGSAAIGSYIISMARDVDDLLMVLLLARLGGLGTAEAIPLDVTPLFETVSDLERAEEVLDALFTDPVLKPHLARREGRQMVMVGYSDSNKDGGIALARWALHRALEGMAAAADRHGITLTVFHGRGGTVSRGGGSVEQAVRAMPAGAIGGRLRLTEQGEVIDAKYGLSPLALRNLERMLGAVVLRCATGDSEAAKGPDGRLASEGWHPLAETIAAAARGAYRSLVYEDPRFLAYFRAATPIDVIERMAIGSRPASRRAGRGVEDLRAIPWVFAWTQCRAMLPAWYGLGTGLAAAREEHGLETLQAAAGAWPFLDALLSDVEMVLAKADLGIAGRYTGLAEADARGIFETLRAEYERTVEAILELRGATSLLEGELALRRSIRLRNPYVDPMNVLQVDLLRRWREAGSPEGPLLDALLSTVNGIARGLQNTG